MENLLGLEGLELDALAERMSLLKRKTSVELGKSLEETKTEYNNQEKFEEWLKKTDISLSTANRHRGRYRLYTQSDTEQGKDTIEMLSLYTISEIFAMKRWKEEKYEELLSLINQGLSVQSVKDYLKANYLEESMTIKDWNFSGYVEELKEEAEEIDIRVLKEKDGKKILNALKNLKKLISECTKLSIINSRQSIRQKIEQINYVSNVLNLNWVIEYNIKK